MPHVSEYLRDRLRFIRERKQMSQTDVARRLKELGYTKIHKTQIAKIEQGERRVTVDDWVRLARALEVRPWTLLVPTDPDAEVEILPKVVFTGREAREWLEGTSGNFGGTPDAPVKPKGWWEEIPDDLAAAERYPMVIRLRVLTNVLRAAAVTGDEEHVEKTLEQIISETTRALESYRAGTETYEGAPT